MFPIFDHIDTLIAADFYEENNQPFLSEAMKLLNRPPLEFRFKGASFTRASAVLLLSWSKSKFFSNSKSKTQSRRSFKCRIDIFCQSYSGARRGCKRYSCSKSHRNL